jgi:hypothetical protein
MQDIPSVVCENLSSIWEGKDVGQFALTGPVKMGKQVGKGSYGSVHLLCRLDGGHDYVVKIEQEPCRALPEMMVETNKLNALALPMAPQIYYNGVCMQSIFGKPTQLCYQVMDLVQGTTFLQLALNTPPSVFEETYWQLFVSTVAEMHRHLEHGHGDMSPKNALWGHLPSGPQIDRWIFIDISMPEPEREPIEDWFTLLYYFLVLDPRFYYLTVHTIELIREQLLTYVPVGNEQRRQRTSLSVFLKDISSLFTSYTFAKVWRNTAEMKHFEFLLELMKTFFVVPNQSAELRELGASMWKKYLAEQKRKEQPANVFYF